MRGQRRDGAVGVGRRGGARAPVGARARRVHQRRALPAARRARAHRLARLRGAHVVARRRGRRAAGDARGAHDERERRRRACGRRAVRIGGEGLHSRRVGLAVRRAPRAQQGVAQHGHQPRVRARRGARTAAGLGGPQRAAVGHARDGRRARCRVPRHVGQHPALARRERRRQLLRNGQQGLRRRRVRARRRGLRASARERASVAAGLPSRACTLAHSARPDALAGARYSGGTGAWAPSCTRWGGTRWR